MVYVISWQKQYQKTYQGDTMTKISKDMPLSELTLRRYEKPNLEDRALVRKLCLSIGLLQPGDSRDVVVDIFSVMLQNKKKAMSSIEIRDLAVKFRKKSKLPLVGVADSNVRRHLKRLRDIFLVEKVKNSYRITEFDDLHNIFEEKIEKYYLKSIVDRVKEYFVALK